ncbi:MAG TPA: VOC family protein [Polyangia bacterium]|nr:VOC family protein [Polyangia bacterium]
MSVTPIGTQPAARAAAGETIDTNLEVVVIPVADVDRSKRFYQSLGWRLDADFSRGDSWRVVQLTPPGSQCSIQFGKGLTAAAPGSVKGLYLVVTDIKAARAELIANGADVSEVFHLDGGLDVSGTKGRAPGPDPQGRSYSSYASFSDPDGNGWLLQEIKTRLPGRGFGVDVSTLTELLREAEQHHGPYEARAPKHHWSGFYAAYVVGRERGQTPEEADREAARYMDARLQTKPA